MNVILTTYQGAILGPIARVLGYILQALYALLADFYIEELFILKAYRKQHIAEELIEAVWSINKGICSVCALKANKGSFKFWKKVIKKSGYECEVKDMDDVYFYNIKIK